jgi:hypothetical protein
MDIAARAFCIVIGCVYIVVMGFAAMNYWRVKARQNGKAREAALQIAWHASWLTEEEEGACKTQSHGS